jgi:glycosyltransferase involved in cell wall biosynthesis
MLTFRLCQLRPVAVVLHGQWAGPIGALAARIAGIRRIVYVARWPAFYDSSTLWRSVRNFAAEALPMRIADKVVVLSMDSRYQYMLRFPSQSHKLALIPNSLDVADAPTKQDADAVRLTHGWLPDSLHVLSIGRLAEQKQVDWLLDSWAIVHTAVPNARLWIVGDGEMRARLEGLSARLGLSGSVAFLGSRDNSFAYIMAADIVAMTSLYEGHANVPLEAAVCGKPVVANNVDGIRHSITDGSEGFLVHPADTASFAERLIRLLKDPALRERMGKAALERATGSDPSIHQSAFLKLLRDLGVSAGTDPHEPSSESLRRDGGPETVP